MVFALEDSLQKTIVLRWNEYSFCFYTGPNQVRIMDQMPNRLSVRVQLSVVETGTYEGIGQRLIVFCGVFFIICSKHFESFQASFDYVGQNMEATITSLRLRVRQGRCTTC